MDVRKLDDLLAQGRSIFEMKIAVAYYARVSTDKDEQLNSLENQQRPELDVCGRLCGRGHLGHVGC